MAEQNKTQIGGTSTGSLLSAIFAGKQLLDINKDGDDIKRLLDGTNERLDRLVFAMTGTKVSSSSEGFTGQPQKSKDQSITGQFLSGLFEPFTALAKTLQVTSILPEWMTKSKKPLSGTKAEGAIKEISKTDDLKDKNISILIANSNIQTDLLEKILFESSETRKIFLAQLNKRELGEAGAAGAIRPSDTSMKGGSSGESGGLASGILSGLGIGALMKSAKDLIGKAFTGLGSFIATTATLFYDKLKNLGSILRGYLDDAIKALGLSTLLGGRDVKAPKGQPKGPTAGQPRGPKSGPIAKTLGKVGPGVAAIAGAYDLFQIEESLKRGEITEEEASRERYKAWGSSIGGVVGAVGGSLLPAPGVGTVAGGVAGSVAGSALGEKLYDMSKTPSNLIAPNALNTKINFNDEQLKQADPKLYENFDKTRESIYSDLIDERIKKAPNVEIKPSETDRIYKAATREAAARFKKEINAVLGERAVNLQGTLIEPKRSEKSSDALKIEVNGVNSVKPKQETIPQSQISSLSLQNEVMKVSNVGAGSIPTAIVSNNSVVNNSQEIYGIRATPRTESPFEQYRNKVTVF